MTKITGGTQIRNLPYRIHKDLSMLLDTSGTQDWKALIAVLPDGMYNLTQIAMLERAGRVAGGSSASELLRDLGHQLLTVKELIGYLERINHQEALLLIKPHEPVKITKQPESLSAQVGQRITLKCNAKGFPRPEYQWYKDEEEADNGFTKELIMNSITLDDKGEYSCKVTNRMGAEYTNKVTIQVVPVAPRADSVPCVDVDQQLFPPSSFADKPVENNAKTTTVYSGQNFQLTCNGANEIDLLYFQWFKNGYAIPKANNRNLEWSPFQHGDEGYYSCRMTGPDGDIMSPLSHLKLGTLTHNVERQFATGKIALIIGNQKYAVSRYPNKELVHPEDDAQALASILIRIGFKVLCLVNLTKQEMEKAVEGFCDLLRISEGMYGFFYFCGHGFEENGKTYLVPVDAPKDWDHSIAVCAESILAQMQSSKTMLDVLVLDVCRVPLDGAGDTKKAFEPPFIAGAQSVICYATCPQSQAFERRNDTNGIYMKHLLQHIHKDEQLETMLHGVHSDVREEAKRHQITAYQSPSHFTSTYKKFSLRDPVVRDLDRDPTLPWFEYHRLPSAHVLEFDHGIRVEHKFHSICSNMCELSLHITNMGNSIDCKVYLLKLSAENLEMSAEEMNQPRSVMTPFVAKSDPYQTPRDTRSLDYENVTTIPSLQRLQGNILLVIEVVYKTLSGQQLLSNKNLIITKEEFGITSLFN